MERRLRDHVNDANLEALRRRREMLVLSRMTSSRRARASFCLGGQYSVLHFPCAESWVLKRLSRPLRVVSLPSRRHCTAAWLVASSFDRWRYQRLSRDDLSDSVSMRMIKRSRGPLRQDSI